MIYSLISMDIYYAGLRFRLSSGFEAFSVILSRIFQGLYVQMFGVPVDWTQGQGS